MLKAYLGHPKHKFDPCVQHGQACPLAVLELGFCASAGRTWRLWAARRSHGEISRATGRPATAFISARASRYQPIPAPLAI